MGFIGVGNMAASAADVELDALNLQLKKLRSALRDCRNELCLQCGRYHDAHNGACDWCKYKSGGEWEQ